MSKQAIAKLDPKQCFTVTGKTGSETFTLTPKFTAQAIEIGNDVGGILLSLQERSALKMEFALNLKSAFAEFKRITKSGFPAFVHDFIDKTCPTSYGKVGTKERSAITHHKLFIGLETLLKQATKYQEREATRQALIAAGINPDNAEDVGKKTKDEREAKADTFQRSFNRCLIDINRRS